MLILNGKLKPVDRVTFSADGSLLAAAGGEKKPLDLWSLDSPYKPRYRLPVRLERTLWSYRFVPGHNLILVVDNTWLVAFDLASGEVVWRVEPSSTSYIAGIDVTPDGRRVVIAYLFQHLSKKGYQIWDLAGRKPPKPRSAMSGSPDCMCRSVAFLPPRNELVFAEDMPGRGSARFNVMTATGQSVRIIAAPYMQSQQFTTSADGRNVAALFGKTALVWNVTDRDSQPFKLRNGSGLNFTGISFHPSGRFLAATSNDATVKLYNTESWELAKTYTWDIGRMRSIAFSPDGTLAAAGSDTGKVVVWDVDL